ncbi:uncharacterized protein BJ171DRAFT_29853 [Polychytrium aggregatum]|uniref:uncharacterized protein n=1 Tax=Polychytrium aggregatum TaxID=110093 RepID=UPI0022FF222C|nr:uncharacterized protein BJ171DRAFT_29853 [Polychytrium aggregatum]KAI9206405.1 hypothetical protein BJ171DRAFT_29853 [Polychytrium aggregatum]
MGMIAAYVAADAYGLKWPFGNLKDEFLFKDVNMALNLLHHEKEYKRFLDKGALGPQRISRLVTEETQRRERENARSSYYSQAAPISPLKSPQPSGASVPPAKEKSQTVSPKWLPTPTYAQGNQKPASVYSHHRSHGDAINGFKDASETNDQPPPPGSTARPSYMMPSQSHVLPPTSLPYPGSQTSRPGSYCKARPAYATHGYHPYNVQARIHPARHTPVGHLHQPPPPVGAPPVQPPPPPPVSVLESDTHRALENQVSAAL